MALTKAHKIFFVVLLLALFSAGWLWNSYNGLVRERSIVDKMWAGVETQYQRRLDLVPNLVATVRGAADFERGTITDVTEARARVMGAASQEERMAALTEFDGALSRLLVTVEAYPQLRATQAFQDLMAQLEGTENRIAVARKDYNDAVQQYTVSITVFPRVLAARLFGFGPRPYFEAAEGAEIVPAVDFPS